MYQSHAETKSSEAKRTSRLVRNLKLTGRTRRERNTENETNKAKIETKKGSEKQCFTVENILTKEKLKNQSQRRQVYVEAHHEEVQGRELRGQGNFEWNTELIETKKLENYTCQVAQGLYS